MPGPGTAAGAEPASVPRWPIVVRRASMVGGGQILLTVRGLRLHPRQQPRGIWSDGATGAGLPPLLITRKGSGSCRGASYRRRTMDECCSARWTEVRSVARPQVFGAFGETPAGRSAQGRVARGVPAETDAARTMVPSSGRARSGGGGARLQPGTARPAGPGERTGAGASHLRRLALIRARSTCSPRCHRPAPRSSGELLDGLPHVAAGPSIRELPRGDRPTSSTPCRYEPVWRSQSSRQRQVRPVIRIQANTHARQRATLHQARTRPPVRKPNVAPRAHIPVMTGSTVVSGTP